MSDEKIEEVSAEESKPDAPKKPSALTKERKPQSQTVTTLIVAATVLALFIIAFYAYGAAQQRERNALIERMTDAIAASASDVAIRRTSEAQGLADRIKSAGEFGDVTFVFRDRVVGTTDQSLSGQSVDWQFPTTQEGSRVSKVDGKEVVDAGFTSGTELVGGMRIVLEP